MRQPGPTCMMLWQATFEPCPDPNLPLCHSNTQLALEAQLPKLSKEAAELRASWGQARTRSANYGEERPLLPGVLGSAGREGHLRGAVAGDVGFDPMGMSADPAAFAK